MNKYLITSDYGLLLVSADSTTEAIDKMKKKYVVDEINLNVQKITIELDDPIDKEKLIIEETKILDCLYLDANMIDGHTSITCLYKNKKEVYDSVSMGTIEKMLINNLYIEKENTAIRINGDGVGMWVFSHLKALGYNVELLNFKFKRAQGRLGQYWS